MRNQGVTVASDRHVYSPAVYALRLGCLLALFLLGVPGRARAWPLLPNSLEVRLTGFLQPEFEAIKNDPLTGKDQIGFALFRARALALANWTTSKAQFGARLEIEGTPQFSLYDAYLDARGATAGGGFWRVVFGQHKAPFSRQILVWDPDLQLIGPGKNATGQALTKAWLTDLAPGHQLGLSFQSTSPIPVCTFAQADAKLQPLHHSRRPQSARRKVRFL